MTASERVPYGSAYGVENIAAQDALRTAAIVALDEAIDAYADFSYGEKARRFAVEHADETARKVFARHARGPNEPEMVSDRLPEIYAHRYASFEFLKDWIVTLTIVGWKLAQAEPTPLTNIGEELALHSLIQDALATLEDRKPECAEAVEQLNALYRSAYEDNDFLRLYELEDSDDLTDLDPTGQLGMTDLRFKNWFRPFGGGADCGVPHPFLLDGKLDS